MLRISVGQFYFSFVMENGEVDQVGEENKQMDVLAESYRRPIHTSATTIVKQIKRCCEAASERESLTQHILVPFIIFHIVGYRVYYNLIIPITYPITYAKHTWALLRPCQLGRWMTIPWHGDQRGTNPAPSGSQEWQWQIPPFLFDLPIKINLIIIYRMQHAIDFPLSIFWKLNPSSEADCQIYCTIFCFFHMYHGIKSQKNKFPCNSCPKICQNPKQLPHFQTDPYDQVSCYFSLKYYRNYWPVWQILIDHQVSSMTTRLSASSNLMFPMCPPCRKRFAAPSRWEKILPQAGARTFKHNL